MSNPGPAASEEVRNILAVGLRDFAIAAGERINPLARPPFDNLPFSLPFDRCHERQKNEPRRGMGARLRGSGHGYYFLLRNFVGGKSEKLFTKSRLPSFQAAWRVENRHAGTGEGISSSE